MKSRHVHSDAMDRADGHTADGPAIVAALAAAELQGAGGGVAEPAGWLREAPGLAKYQACLLQRFGHIIGKRSHHYISKTPSSWLVVGDRRREIAADIALVIERHGIGVGMLVLHLQQLNAGHIPAAGGNPDAAVAAGPTEALRGLHNEAVLFVPVRKFRADTAALAALNIAKPRELWRPERIVTHERDRHPCFYCSCGEMNPAEVVVDLDGARHGLSRNYSLGFTFAPFGNPLTTVHFLAWDRARAPLNMNRVPMTVSDLVKLTREINVSIRAFFRDAGVADFPVIDGISNGWAGNTIYHQHFQFFRPEHESPILRAQPRHGGPLVGRDDVSVRRLVWPLPVYRIKAASSLNTGLVGNDLAGVWRLLGGARKAPYKTFADGYAPAENEKVPANTQNIYVPGATCGGTAYFILRDRMLVDYRPEQGTAINPLRGFMAQIKKNIGVLESTGTLIVDDRPVFDAMRGWSERDISMQIGYMLASVAPAAGRIQKFEENIGELFPA